MSACGGPTSRKDKNQNIQVFVRLRPLNNRERDIKSIGVVEVAGPKEIVVRQPGLDNKLTKKFTFDRAFGPNSKQVDVYQEVVSPLIEEVLAGYNCTVFAYGQTGTGKTHTMVGESSANGDVPWQNDPMAGIVPRSLSQLFDELRITNSEYTVRVSYLELYNEELFDLLSSSEDNSKLRIYEDVTRKGSNIINGLEEITVYNKNEVYKIMAKGQEKRRTASTLMNAQSSRSHTVFTIVVHMKENSPDGEELMKIGKLNLVDLAGSENISKAGTDNPSRKERARECVNINQSLLTLGRVITALVERHPHIPYRESKLTRLLQESLGGRTKTSIIATISPGHRDIEETLSTLEYAHRARNIQNKPEINQKLTKIAVLKEYSEEIDRLKRDLQASRERNGVYLANETYAEMTLKLEEQEKEIQEQIMFIKAMKEEKDRIEELFNEMSTNLKETEIQLDVTNKTLNHTKNLLRDNEEKLVETRFEVEEQKHLVTVQTETEKKLSEQAKNLLNVAAVTSTDVDLLQNTLDKKRSLENSNLMVTKSFGDKSSSHRQKIKEHVETFVDSDIATFTSCFENFDSFLTKILNHGSATKEMVMDMSYKLNQTLALTQDLKNSYIEKDIGCVQKQFTGFKEETQTLFSKINDQMIGMASLLSKLDEARENDRKEMENMKDFVSQWKDSSKAKMIRIRDSQNTMIDEFNNNMEKLIDQHCVNNTKITEENKRLSNLREDHDNEIATGLLQLKSLISALEEKHTKNKTELNNLEKNNVISLTVLQNSFTESLKNNSETTISKMQNVNNVMNMLWETSKSFAKGMMSRIDEYSQRIFYGNSINVDLRNTANEASELNSDASTKCLAKTDEISTTVCQLHKNTITEQHEFHNSFLKQCHSKCDEILVPIVKTIQTIEEKLVQLPSDLKNYQDSVEVFKNEFSESLDTYNEMEYKFLNDEYKLYSPTGKTPNRKDYKYSQSLACTSPHERILMRFRSERKPYLKKHSSTNLSLTDNSIIELDDATPLKRTKGNSQSDIDLSSNLTSVSLSDSPPTFTEPKSVDVSSIQNKSIAKSISDNNIHTLGNKQQSKENLNFCGSDKKENISRLRQPLVMKKVLGNKNNS